LEGYLQEELSRKLSHKDPWLCYARKEGGMKSRNERRDNWGLGWEAEGMMKFRMVIGKYGCLQRRYLELYNYARKRDSRITALLHLARMQRCRNITDLELFLSTTYLVKVCAQVW